MAKDNDPNRLSPIALRMKEDLQLSGKGERTQESYIRMLRKFTEFLKREPDSATENDLRNYLLHIKNQRQWSNSTINVAYCSLKFFFSKTCSRDWPTLKKLKVQPELKLSTVLTINEVQILLKLIEKPAMLCFFTTVYSLGLRLQEALNLQISDIDSKRMLVHIHRGKGARDRLVPLPMSTLIALRLYYSTHRNRTWIFPSESKDHTKAPTAEVPMRVDIAPLALVFDVEEVISQIIFGSGIWFTLKEFGKLSEHTDVGFLSSLAFSGKLPVWE